MGKYLVRSCANIESCLYFELMIDHFFFFFFSSLFLKFVLTPVLFLCVCVYACTHVQPLAVEIVPVHTEADLFLWMYWKFFNVFHSSLIAR